MTFPSQVVEFGVKLRPFDTMSNVPPLTHDSLLFLSICIITAFNYEVFYLIKVVSTFN